MGHMPTGQLLRSVLRPMILAAAAWKAAGAVTPAGLDRLLAGVLDAARSGLRRGTLAIKQGPGVVWQETSFGAGGLQKRSVLVESRREGGASPPTSDPPPVDDDKSAAEDSPAAEDPDAGDPDAQPAGDDQ